MLAQLYRGTETCFIGDKLRDDIQIWLSPPDPWKNYNVARESRYKDTGAWFVNGTTLSEWKESGPSSLLWIHGKRQFGPALLFRRD
jgi:ankyrin repeat domain-containing protein 50